jgi:hypothetical protein
VREGARHPETIYSWDSRSHSIYQLPAIIRYAYKGNGQDSIIALSLEAKIVTPANIALRSQPNGKRR